MNKIPEFLFLVCFLAVGYIPYFGSIDKLAPQWLLLSILSFAYLLISLIKGGVDWKLINNISIKSFVLFLVCILFSIIFSVNIIESSIVFFRWLTIALVFLSFIIILSKIKKIENIFLILVIFSLFEILLPFIEYLRIVSIKDFSFADSNYLKTFTGNKNITSASLSLKFPFLLYAINRYKNPVMRIFLTIFLFIGFYDLILISSRAALLGVMIVSLGCILYFIFYKKDKYVIVYPLLYVSALLLSTLTLSNSNVLITDRVSTINTDDQSTNERIRFYRHGLNAFINSPLIGSGIGTWKTESIKYDKENIQSYVVPYHMHNDFLQLAVEIGVFGLLAYLSMFWFSLKFLILNLDKKKEILIPLILSFIIYGIDANFNFPMARPIMQVQLFLLFALVIKLKNEKI